ncbi:MAG: cytochrome-c oxidase, cbb3-type subunit III [Gammaproteobacteria bacterium]|nr:cytochrome-c oxidase, cbb3-type subunit III [Gammaproteobacteria bacterium]
MSNALSIFVIVLVLITVIGSLLLLQWTTKMPVSGDDESNTTGHRWDEDIVEGNNPLPRWWLYLFWITAVWMLVYLIIYPGAGNLAGITGWSQVDQYNQEVELAEQRYGDIYAAFAAVPLGDLANDPDAIALGRNLYQNNCATCHGADGRGAKGFPDLTAGVWLYGGAPETIEMTIANGRNGVMPALGAALGEQGLTDVIAYVLSLSGNTADSGSVENGQQKYMTMCVACHGPTGTGNPALGAPNLTDDVWLHGASAAAIQDVIVKGRMSQMPAQRDVLSEDRIRVLTGYVLSLSSASGE